MKSGFMSVKLARVACGISCAELAARIGKSRWYVRRLEHGSGPALLSAEIRMRIAEVLETPEEILFPNEAGK